MKTWYKLNPEETSRIYCIPAEIANHPNNHFWGLTYHPKEFLEGSWPLVILSTNDKYPSVITLQIHTLHMEVLHESEPNDEVKNFNPLEWMAMSGYLSLRAEQLDGLSNLLKTQKHLFANAESVANEQSVFRLLHNDEIQFYRLHPEWFPGLHRTYYMQVAQPAMAAATNTISLLSTSSQMTVMVLTFTEDELLDKSFTPLRRSSPQLYLNWSGLLEFADILSQAVKRPN
ncbi:MAG: hypothetical protein ACOYNY_36915 [Caldilineaceae bacterium]